MQEFIKSPLEDLIFLEDWEDKYEFLIDLGIAMPSLDLKYKVKENQIFGCQSRVWLVLEIFNGKLQILGDSDALFTKGLVALLIAEYNLKTLEEINHLPNLLEKYNLTQNLSLGRQNGLTAMLNKVGEFVKKQKHS